MRMYGVSHHQPFGHPEEGNSDFLMATKACREYEVDFRNDDGSVYFVVIFYQLK